MSRYDQHCPAIVRVLNSHGQWELEPSQLSLASLRPSQSCIDMPKGCDIISYLPGLILYEHFDCLHVSNFLKKYFVFPTVQIFGIGTDFQHFMTGATDVFCCRFSKMHVKCHMTMTRQSPLDPPTTDKTLRLMYESCPLSKESDSFFYF